MPFFVSSQGIYRLNGAKSRVEKLCQAFENGKDLVELSDLSPHDISNVLKLYLRQVGDKFSLKGRVFYVDVTTARYSSIFVLIVKWLVETKKP